MGDNESRDVSPEAQRELVELAGRLIGLLLAQRVWQRLLDEADRRQLGGDFDHAYDKHKHAVGLWRAVRQATLERAMVDVGFGVDLLKTPKRNWLLREIGESDDNYNQDDRPSWDSATGELLYRGKRVRKVRQMTTVTNIEKVLDAFQAEEWPRTIGSPFGSDQKRAHETARSLNKNLASIRFHVSDGGETLYWATVD